MNDLTLDDLEQADKFTRKDYTIISFKNNRKKGEFAGALATLNGDGKGEGGYDALYWHGDMCFTLEELMSDNKLSIHSVRRESDGEIFSIGDTIEDLEPDEEEEQNIFEIEKIVLSDKIAVSLTFWMKDCDMYMCAISEMKKIKSTINIRSIAPPALKGTRDSYLVVGGKIPSAFYTTTEAGEGEPIWYLYDEKKQVYKMQGWHEAEIDDLHYFEQPLFRPFYNDAQINTFKQDYEDRQALEGIAGNEYADVWSKYIHEKGRQEELDYGFTKYN